MSTKIYLLKTHKINVTNLFLATLICNEGDRVYETCTYDLVSNNQFFSLSEGQMVKQFVENPALNFRNIDWSTNLLKLQEIVDSAIANNQILIFGNHDAGKLLSIKNHFGKLAKTISINYTESLYPYLLNNAVKFHIWSLTNSCNPINEYDQQLLNTLSDTDLIDHYTDVFDQMQLFPKQSIDHLEYDIDVSDFFNETAFFSHFENIGISVNESAKQYYHSWQLSAS